MSSSLRSHVCSHTLMWPCESTHACETSHSVMVGDIRHAAPTLHADASSVGATESNLECNGTQRTVGVPFNDDDILVGVAAAAGWTVVLSVHTVHRASADTPVESEEAAANRDGRTIDDSMRIRAEETRRAWRNGRATAAPVSATSSVAEADRRVRVVEDLVAQINDELAVGFESGAEGGSLGEAGIAPAFRLQVLHSARRSQLCIHHVCNRAGADDTRLRVAHSSPRGAHNAASVPTLCGELMSCSPALNLVAYDRHAHAKMRSHIHTIAGLSPALRTCVLASTYALDVQRRIDQMLAGHCGPDFNTMQALSTNVSRRLKLEAPISFPYAINHLRNCAAPSQSSRSYAWVRTMARLVIDALLGAVLLPVVLRVWPGWSQIPPLAEAVSEGIRASTNTLAHAPFGLKLNAPLADAVVLAGSCVSDIWDHGFRVLNPLLAHTWGGLPFGIAIGASLWLWFLADAFYLATWHIQFMYALLKRVMSWELSALAAYGQLFRGFKRNLLRRRTDHAAYDAAQLLMGTLVLCIVIFLFPTVAVFLLLFWLLRCGTSLVVLAIVAAARIVREIRCIRQVQTLRGRVAGRCLILPPETSTHLQQSAACTVILKPTSAFANVAQDIGGALRRAAKDMLRSLV